jgi:hypothetical protein
MARISMSFIERENVAKVLTYRLKILQQRDVQSFIIFSYSMKKMAHTSRYDSSFSSQNALHPLQPIEGLAFPFADILGNGPDLVLDAW